MSIFNHISHSTFYNCIYFIPVADTIALACVYVLPTVADDLFYSPVACNLVVFFQEVYPVIPNWILVCITLERMVGTLFPHKINQWATKTKFVMFLTVLTVAVVFLFVGFALTVEYERIYQNVCKSDAIFDEIQVSFSLLMVSILPSFCIIIFNTVIIIRLIRSHRTQRRMTSSNADLHMIQITISLITISVAFVLLTFPHFAAKIDRYFNDSPMHGPKVYLEKLLINLMFYLFLLINNGINFWLYCMTGKHFRHRVIQLFCKMGRVCMRQDGQVEVDT